MFILNCFNISQYYCFYCIFDQINAASKHKRLLKKNTFKKILLTNASVHTTF